MWRAALSAVLALTASVALADDTLSIRTSGDGQQTEIGSRDSAARTHSLRFTIAEADLERWPEPVTVTITNADNPKKSIAVKIPPQFAIKPHTFIAPAGSYDLFFSAPHYLQARRFVKLTANQNLGTIALSRYPVISGALRMQGESPVVGALITDRAKGSTQSDPSGLFQLEVTGEWPKRIEISYPGLATKDIEVPKAQASLRLPQITLVKGSRLTFSIEGLTSDVDVDLAREVGYKHFDVLRTAHVKKDSPRYNFEDVERGKYTILLRGEGPLQRTSVSIDVREESTSGSVRLDPLALTITVYKGQASVSGAVVAVQTNGSQWSTEMHTNDQGLIETEAWARGNVVFAVKGSAESAPTMLFKEIDRQAREASIQLDLPSHEIAGRVVDGNGDSPIANATVEVDSVNDDGSGGKLTTKTDSTGAFHVEGLHDGSHEVFALAENYARSETTKVHFDQAAPNQQVTIRMSQGLARTLHLITPAGWPIVNAMVAESVNNGLSDLLKSDETGKVTLRAPAGAKVAAYVIPHEGSFAVVHLSSDETDKTVTVPNGSASLEIHANDTEGKPLAHLEFVMWYDGELIPPDIMDVLSMQRDLEPITNNDGIARLDRLPPGYFQFWPVRTKQELQNVIDSEAPAPVQVSLKDGLNVASMTFKKKP